MESTSDARISLTILLGCESRSFMMLSITDISVAVVSCEYYAQTPRHRMMSTVSEAIQCKSAQSQHLQFHNTYIQSRAGCCHHA